MKRLLPAYPLFVNDPYFSVWSDNDELNKSDTIFWTGMKRKTYGLVYANGQCYSFLGIVEKAIPLKQTDVQVTAFSTKYSFDCDLFMLNVSFVSPLIPNDIELMSRPVCYFIYEIKPKCQLSNLKITLALHEEHTYNTKSSSIMGGGFSYDDYEIAYFGLSRQLPMSQSFDSIAADWGYTYISAQRCFYTTASSLDYFISNGVVNYEMDEHKEKVIVGIDEYDSISSPINGKILVAFDEQCSIFYYGEWLKGYYFRNGKTIFDAIEEAHKNFNSDISKLNIFEDDLNARLKEYDDDYKLLVYASLRQSVGAHKLVENKKKELLFLSKECYSNGSIATVDVTYPSMPLFLLYNPDLIAGMIRPIFDFAKMPVWNFPFAPHDAGLYPYCLGQTYGLKSNPETNGKFLSNSFSRYINNDFIYTYPFVYQYPKNSDIYDFKYQMPLEECGNMLIIAYALLYRKSSYELIKENYQLLKLWYEYIENNGLIPKMQLCTDDFAGQLDENVNLSIKAIQAVKCFSLIAKEFGFKEDAERSNICFNQLYLEYSSKFKDFDHQPLSYRLGEETFSLKYNMVYDIVFNTNIFSKEMRDNELKYYLNHSELFGVPLDNRSNLTKTDWLLYASSLSSDKDIQKSIYSKVADFLRNAPERLPFSDLYDVKTGIITYFRNRSVQGGIFILLLIDEINKL